MIDSEFSAFAALLADPILVVDLEGRITATNAAADRLFASDGSASGRLQDRSADPQATSRLLAAWARSAQPLPGALELRTARGNVTFRADGVRVVAPGDPQRVVVRLRERRGASGAFHDLNAQISRLGQEVTRRMRAESRLAGQLRLLEVIARGATLEESLEAIARFVESESSEGALASILLVEDGRLRHGAGPTLPAAYAKAIDGVAIGPRVGSCGTAAYRRESVTVTDIATDPLWTDFAELALAHGLRACWSTPVIDRSGDVLATVANYYNEPRNPSASDAELTGLASHLVGIAIERRRVERALLARAAELADMNARKNEFLAMLGHELRNPLSSMVVTLELLASNGAIASRETESVELLRGQLGLLRRLVDDLLDVSRVTRGKIELRRRIIDVRDILAVVAGAQPRDGRRFTLTTPDSPVWVDADPERLQQVIGNLVHNARKFTQPDGTIEVVLGVDAGQARLQVKDDGEGIDPAELPHMFELFAQSPRALDRPEGGLGIGLTLVQSLVASHGGTVEARSAGRGKGSEFEFRLPLSDPPAGGAAAREDRNRGVGPGNPVDVLVVDDDRDSALLLARLLDHWGHTTRVAHDGATAIDAIAERVPDVVILDIGLPGLDGFEVARRIRGRAEDHGGSCTLVALTGYGQASDEARAREVGFDAFLIKPVDLPSLKSLIVRGAR